MFKVVVSTVNGNSYINHSQQWKKLEKLCAHIFYLKNAKSYVFVSMVMVGCLLTATHLDLLNKKIHMHALSTAKRQPDQK